MVFDRKQDHETMQHPMTDRLIKSIERQNGIMGNLIEAILHGTTNRGTIQGRAYQLSNQQGSLALKNDQPSIFFSQRIAQVDNDGVLGYRPPARQRLLALIFGTSISVVASFATNLETSGDLNGLGLPNPDRFLISEFNQVEGPRIVYATFGEKGVLLAPRKPLFLFANATCLMNLSLQLAPSGD